MGQRRKGGNRNLGPKFSAAFQCSKALVLKGSRDCDTDCPPHRGTDWALDFSVGPCAGLRFGLGQRILSPAG